MDATKLKLWHDRLGHPGSGMMQCIIHQSHGHIIEILKIPIKRKNYLVMSAPKES